MGVLIGQLIGALIITFALTRLVKWALGKKVDANTKAFLAFTIVVLFALGLASHTMGFWEAFLTYVPALLIWLLMDLIRARNMNCPFCGEIIKRKAILCKHCGKEISTSGISSSHTENKI